MRSSEGERLCQQAQVYYYDLLGQDEAAVPAAVRRHVATCPACREEMDRLREALSEAPHPGNAAGARQDETIEALARQFQLLGERVTCAAVKPLLPELALASPRIRIPTPVTVHVDHCPPCAGDLAAIRALHLTAGQLKRLSRLFATGRAASSNRERDACAARDGLAPVAAGSLPDTDGGITCREIAPADLFDDVVPGGGTPPVRQEERRRHVRDCPVCLDKVRTLRRTIDEIVARPDSEIVTVYHTQEDAGRAGTDVEGGYPYPVNVQVLHRLPDAAEGQADRAVPATRRLRLVARPLAALAALMFLVIAPASLLRTKNSTASGTNVADVDRILAQVKNVRTVTHYRDGTPVEESWIARDAEILLNWTKDRWVLYDLGHNRKTALELKTGSRVSAGLSGNERKNVSQRMANRVRDVLTGVAPDAQLRRVAGRIDGDAGRDFDVYELPVSSQTSHVSVRDYWLVHLDPATGRPQRTELYRQKLGEDRGGPVTTTIFTYPTDQEVDEAIRTLFPAP